MMMKCPNFINHLFGPLKILRLQIFGAKKFHWLSQDFSGLTNKRANFEIQNFPVHPIGRFNGPCASYKQPVEIMCYSHDSERNLHMDDRELRYYYPPDLENCDLSNGYETYVQRENSGPAPIHPLLDALTHAQRLSGDKNLMRADLISWRGIFTKILCTPYNKNEPWELGATLWNNTIFIEEHDTEYTNQNSGGATPKHKLMIYWGYKFENLCTISKPASQVNSVEDPELTSRKTSIVNTNVQYCSVAKTSLGNNRIIMGAEIDCLDGLKSEKHLNPISNYLELKTSKVINGEGDNYKFEKYKLLKFWAQSFLIGVPKIIVGFRDDNGFVKEIQEFKTLEIPRMVRGKSSMWDAAVCLNFANEFLDWLKTVVVNDDPRSSYTISYKQPFRSIEVTFSGTENPVLAERHLESLRDNS